MAPGGMPESLGFQWLEGVEPVALWSPRHVR